MIDFAKKRKKLEQAKTNLKNKFVGLDDIIDEVFDKITAWYLFPNVMTRPLIINLWGLTGVGKTDLVRSIVKELSLGDRFLELQMTSSGIASDSYADTVKEILLSSDLEPQQPGVLLLDEIQRFRTVTREGDDSDSKRGESGKFQDIWMLLSDGKFANSADTKDELMGFLYGLLYKNERASDDDDDDYDDLTGEPTSNPKDKNINFKQTYYKAKQIKSLFRLTESVTDIMKWDQDKIFSIAERAADDPHMYTEIDYSKLLVFISGNLDEAFRNAVNVSDAERDADDVHKKTSKINLVNIKDGLNRRFRPEQISRFGNVHIIYPSLNKKSYERIIEKRLEKLVDKVKEECDDIKLVFDDSIHKLIYMNGVFPVQGVRPVLSTVDDVFNVAIPTMIIEAIENSAKQVDVSYSDNIIRGKLNNKSNELIVPYQGPLDRIRQQHSLQRDNICITAVHEAGHAVVYAVLFKTVPPSVNINETSSHNAGSTSLHSSDGSKDTYLKLICTLFGGTVAERTFFGPDYATTGCSQDVKQATELAGLMIRHSALYADDTNFVSYIPSHDDDEVIETDTGVNDTNEEIRRILKEQYNLCGKIITRYQSTIRAIADKLILDKAISAPALSEILTSHDIDCAIVDSEQKITIPYEDIYNNEIDN